MKNIELIKEEILPINTRWLKKFFDKTELAKCDYAHCIHTEKAGKVQLIKGYITRGEGSPDPVEVDSFSRYIKKHKPNTFKEVIFLLDIFSIYPTDTRDFKKISLLKSRSPKAKVIEAILKDSHGIIIWHYQLEDILNLYMLGRPEIVSLRKDINAQIPGSFNKLKKFKVDDKISLYDFVNNRRVLNRTLWPNIHGASALHEILGLKN